LRPIENGSNDDWNGSVIANAASDKQQLRSNTRQLERDVGQGISALLEAAAQRIAAARRRGPRGTAAAACSQFGAIADG